VHSWFVQLSHAIARGDATVVGAGIAALATSATFFSWQTWRSLERARTIEDIPTAKARSAHQGYVELEGRGQQMDGEPIIAPLSGLPCVWYRYRVERQETYEEGGRTRQRWVAIESGESTDVFWLEDNTGRVAVDPVGAEITPKHKDVWNSHADLIGFARQPAQVVQFLAKHRSGERLRFTEERINPHDHIYAIGLLRNLGSLASQPTVDEEVRQLLRQWKADQALLKERFDLDQDGKIDQKEWALARSQARREVNKARRQQNAEFIEGINVLSRPADRRRPYLLSAYPQTQLVRKYRIWASVCGVAFAALAIVALWVFNTRFGG
jgi:hypothetical protein